VAVGVSGGPAALPLRAVGQALLTRLPWHPGPSVPAVAVTIVWQVRLPRVVLGALVGAMLAGGGAAYQGVFRNPLADPYLLGVAAGAGLGAAPVIGGGFNMSLLAPAAVPGGVRAVAITFRPGAGRGGHAPGAGTASIVLAGVAVAALLMALQEYLQQQHTQSLPQIYSWILGELSLASWSDVTLILPYVVISAGLLIAHRRLLDVLRV